MRFAANLSMLFTEYPFINRFAEAADCGFSAVEFWFPFQYGGIELLPVIQSAGLQVALFNLDPGETGEGDWGTLGIPGREDHFKRSFEQAIELAILMDCKRLNALAGMKPASIDSERCLDQIRQNLCWAAGQVSEGMHIVLEALNPFDKPGYLIPSPNLALDLVREINHPAIGLLLDVYHACRVNGDIIHLLSEGSHWIKHIQIADAPDRHQPGTGVIQFERVFEAIQKINYEGYIGLEYIPLGTTREAIQWRQMWDA
jgi:hydroxypyruvate isomerase